MALDASVELINAAGQTRSMRLEEFFVAPVHDVTRENDLRAGEILTTIRLPRLPQSARSDYVKLGERAAFDWPLAEIAAMLDVKRGGICKRASIVLGAAAPIPYRARAGEHLLIGKAITPAIALEAAQAAVADATPLSGNTYKVPIFVALLQRTIMRTAEVDPGAP